MNHDITFCNAVCETKECPRNMSQIDPERRSDRLSWAEFWKSCPAYQPKEKTHD